MKACIQVFVAIYLTTAVHGEICCAPEQWEGLIYREGGLYRTNNEFRNYSYDAISRRKFVAGFDHNLNTTFKLILDWKTHKAYRYLPHHSACKTWNLTCHFRRECIEDGSTKRNATYLGAGSNTLDVEVYSGSVDNENFDVKILVVVSKHEADCVPISRDVWGSLAGDDNYFSSQNIAGVTLGIQDASIFTPPSYCSQTAVGNLPYDLQLEFGIVTI